MNFDAVQYGPVVAEILALDGDGARALPLVIGRATSAAVAAKRLRGAKAADLFPDALAPDAALSGLWLYFGCFEESHSISQDLNSPEGSYWHGILHRQEPDPGNAGYWFRRVGHHAIFPKLRTAAGEAIEEMGDDSGFRLRSAWNPFEFIDFCEEARRLPGSRQEALASRIALAEWQLLFDYCAAAPGVSSRRPLPDGRGSE